MRYSELTNSDKDLIIRSYQTSENRSEVQAMLSTRFNSNPRTIRYWANKLGIGQMAKNITNPSKILIYDIETSRIPAWVWWTGKTYINYKQLMEEPKIITVAYSWLGGDKVYSLVWDKNQSDENLMERFLDEYNKADLVIGYNNDNFDNRWINARAMKYGLEVNTHVRSLDLMKECKRLLRLPSYSMDYVAKYFNVTHKKAHEGVIMWEKIQTGDKEESQEYLDKMVDYNVGDIITTEDIYLKLRKYMSHKIHFGVLNNGEKYSCPNCGGVDVQEYKTTVTPVGTIQRLMECNEDGTRYRLANKQYINFLDYKINA